MRKVITFLFLFLLLNKTYSAVSYTYTSPVCGTLTTGFTNTSTGLNIAYFWSFDDPTSGASNFAFNLTKITQSHTFSAYGTYNVKFYILDLSNKPVDSVTHQILVVQAPNVLIIPSSFKTYCQGDSENNFINATLDPAFKYTWNPTPQSTNATGNSVEYRFTHTQTYTVTVTDTTTGCISTKSITVNFVNCTPLTSQFTFVAPLCGVLTANFKNMSLVSHHYIWYFGDPASGGSNILTKADTSSVSHTFSDTGSFYVSLVVFDSLETKKDSSVKLVKIYKQSYADIFNKDTTICIRSGVTLSGTGLGTAVWSPATGLSTTTGYTTIASPSVTTTYYLTTNNNSCTAIDSVKVIIQAKPVTNFKVDSLCIGDYYTFSAYNQNFTYYHWDFGDGDTAIGANAVHSYDSSGVKLVKLYVIDGPCDTQITNYLYVLSDPIASFTPDKLKAEITKANFTFSNKSTNSMTYIWDFGDQNTSTDISPTHTYTDTGWFQVILTAKNKLGCEDTVSMIIRVDNLYKYFVPSAFSPNEGGPYENEVFKAFGPAGTTQFQMTIFDRWGELVFTSTKETIAWNGRSSDGSICGTGNYVYLIRFKDPTGKRLVFKGIVTLLR